jgi:exodeoxyribonuclease V alpha subunit
MSGYRFRPMSNLHPPPEWRDIDVALARWVLAHGGSPGLAHAAAWASLADGRGDTALALDGAGRHGMPAPSDADLAALAGQPMVSDGGSGQPTPFVLQAGRFYLWRNFSQEVEVARLLGARRKAAAPAPLDEAALDSLFHHDRSAAVAAQRAAVQRAPGHRLFVLTGGPGTGKTTTVLRMLLAMLHQAGPAQPTVRIAAPTGKAAQRLAQSLREGKQAIARHDQHPLPESWHRLLERIPDDEPLTLHRLLGAGGRSQRFRHHADDPLAADIVVVDEASMIDLALLRGLLAALRPEASLILVGDPDQLSSVGAGSVLIDLVAALDGASDLARLHHSFRADDALLPVLDAVRLGDAQAFAQASRAAGDQFSRLETREPRQLSAHLRHWADALHQLWQHHQLTRPLDAGPAGAARRLQAVRQRQLLCARREGEFGALACNARLEARLRQLSGQPDDAAWYPGRLVMVTRNDYSAGLFNGDIGLCLSDPDGRLWVWFEASDLEGPTARRFAPGLLPSHEGGFAITVHKSQGSEYREVGLVLPPEDASGLVSRQLVYTAISRARESITVLASDGVLERALATALGRQSGLAHRIPAGVARLRAPGP